MERKGTIIPPSTKPYKNPEQSKRLLKVINPYKMGT